MITPAQTIQLATAFNADDGVPFSDFLVASTFQQPATPLNHYERVCILDALFDTRLRQSRPVGGTPRKSLYTISEAIRECLPALHETAQHLGDGSLATLDFADNNIRQRYSDLLHTVLDCLNNNSLSFAAKYLHFIFPGLFPIWDRLVPQAINDFVDHPLFPPNPPKTIDNYLLLCAHYREVIADFTDDDIANILEQDFVSQPEDWRWHNTIVRILDKAYWWHGRQAHPNEA
jgi:hypothetical protein